MINQEIDKIKHKIEIAKMWKNSTDPFRRKTAKKEVVELQATLKVFKKYSKRI